MSEGRMRLQCRGCDTIYDVCDMPMDVLEVVKHVKAAKCPTCDKGSNKADIYVGGKHESESA